MTSLISEARHVRALGLCACALAPALVLALLACSPPYFSAHAALVATFRLDEAETQEARHFTAFARSERERFVYTQSLDVSVVVCRLDEAPGTELVARVRLVADAPYTDIVEAEVGLTPCTVLELVHGHDGRRSTAEIERGVTIEVERLEGASHVPLFIHAELGAHVECRDDYEAPASFVNGIREDD